jgi:hypothetical protein
MGTTFASVYDCFLGKITDDMYIELTPQDTIRDLRSLLINAIPGFEFPRKNINSYKIETARLEGVEETDPDYILDNEEIVSLADADEVIFSGGNAADYPAPESGEDDEDALLVDRSAFEAELTNEEINILAILMQKEWLQRQIASVENVRMKYSGSDFKFTSQANHLAKLLNLLTKIEEQSTHMQRLYKRRVVDSRGNISSNWARFGGVSALDD